MHIQITIATVTLMTFAIVLLRIFWLRVPATVRFFIIRTAIVLVVLHLILSAIKWETNSDLLNVTLTWLAVASYEFLVMLFSLLHPRWLTTICAFVLLILVFTASALIPLAPIFNTAIYPLNPIGNHLFYRNVPWRGDSANSGRDLKIYYQPASAPFFRHIVLVFPFNAGDCNAEASFAILQLDGKHILARCPHWPSQSPGSDDRIFPLPSLRFAQNLSPEVVPSK